MEENASSRGHRVSWSLGGCPKWKSAKSPVEDTERCPVYKTPCIRMAYIYRSTESASIVHNPSKILPFALVFRDTCYATCFSTCFFWPCLSSLQKKKIGAKTQIYIVSSTAACLQESRSFFQAVPSMRKRSPHGGHCGRTLPLWPLSNRSPKRMFRLS